MNDFESERAAKAARFRQLAEKHENIAAGRHFAARERLEMIPLGQPTPVGPHSEKRHRKDLNRINRHFAEASPISVFLMKQSRNSSREILPAGLAFPITPSPIIRPTSADLSNA